MSTRRFIAFRPGEPRSATNDLSLTTASQVLLLVEEVREPVERVRPAIAMERPARLGLERLMIHAEIGSSRHGFEAHRDESLSIIGIGLLIGEREEEPAWRVDDPKRSSDVKLASARRLHGDPVSRSLRNVELEVRNGERFRAPPLPELVRGRERAAKTRSRPRTSSGSGGARNRSPFPHLACPGGSAMPDRRAAAERRRVSHRRNVSGRRRAKPAPLHVPPMRSPIPMIERLSSRSCRDST